jgi:molecular chaperone HtpG
MDRAALIDNLGTIARSGTRAFLESGAKDGGALIGQFGVGFYSAFMLADRVDVASRPAGRDEAWRWSSDGKGAFTIEPAALAERGRGTRSSSIFRRSRSVTPNPRRSNGSSPNTRACPCPHRPRSATAPPPALAMQRAVAKAEGRDRSEGYTPVLPSISGQFDEPAVTLHYRAEGARGRRAPVRFGQAVRLSTGAEDPVRLYVRRVHHRRGRHPPPYSASCAA